MQEQAFYAMGCHMLAVIDGDDERATTRLAQAPGWFEQWEQQLSRFRPDSDLARLNAASGRPFAAPAALYEVLRLALDAARQSNGLVRPTLIGALEAAGYDRSFPMLSKEQVTKGTPASQRPALDDWRTIVLDRKAHTISLPATVRLDLGGIAKGWAAEQAAGQLAAAGPALMDAGGDIVVSGPMANGAPWPIGIANPFAPDESLGVLLLVRGSVATSGRDLRHWRKNGREQHHIIDPRTGRPAQTDVVAATVVAPDGPSAEMAAKVALILGSQAGRAWLDARPTLAGLLVLEDGRLVRSRRMNTYLDQSIDTPAAVALPSAVAGKELI